MSAPSLRFDLHEAGTVLALLADYLRALDGIAAYQAAKTRDAKRAARRMIPQYEARRDVAVHHLRQAPHGPAIARAVLSFLGVEVPEELREPATAADGTPDELLLIEVEQIVGMGHGAWDTVPARALVTAFRQVIAQEARGVEP